jgi:hypothetical protein
MPAAARKFESPFPVSPSGGKPGRAGSPHTAHAARQQKQLSRIDAAAPPTRGVSKRFANPPCESPLKLNLGGKPKLETMAGQRNSKYYEVSPIRPD